MYTNHETAIYKVYAKSIFPNTIKNVKIILVKVYILGLSHWPLVIDAGSQD